MLPRPDHDDDWHVWRDAWTLRPDTLYLNHGSFGPPPRPVSEARRQWQQALDEQPMDFFVRQYEPAWLAARARLAEFLHARPNDLVFVENATAGMNIVADSVAPSLRAGEEVLLTDHEYGAVRRIWERVGRERGSHVRIVELPRPLESADQVVDTIFAAVTERTRWLVVSHITSPTAVILPVAAIARRARALGVGLVIDGPHAPLQTAVDLGALDCDFYTASGHKWLSAPFGSGFLFVAPQHQGTIRAPLLSWGRIQPAVPRAWDDEFIWSGTRDPSAYFAMPAAIDFFAALPPDLLRGRLHGLARYARQRLLELTSRLDWYGDSSQREPLVPDSADWYAAMAHVPLPPGEARPLQTALWERFGIEVPIVAWQGRRYIRVSCHLYNGTRDIDRLIEALRSLFDVRST